MRRTERYREFESHLLRQCVVCVRSLAIDPGAMVNDLFIFILSLFMVGKGAIMSTTYAVRVAESFRLSRYVVGFIVVAIISILPETFIAINAALEGVPALGLGTLIGSNITDLTLVFAVIIFFAGRNLKVESMEMI